MSSKGNIIHDNAESDSEESIKQTLDIKDLAYFILTLIDLFLILITVIDSFINYRYFEFEVLLLTTLSITVCLLSDISPYLREKYIKAHLPFTQEYKGRFIMFLLLSILLFFDDGFIIKLSGFILLALSLFNLYKSFKT